MDKIWLRHYQQGVPPEIDPYEYTSLVALIEESCQKFTQKVAYINLGQRITYGELDTLSKQFSAYLQALGLAKGARIAIMMPNLLQYPIALFAILRAGYIVVNVNPLYTSHEFTRQMNDAEAEALIVLANCAHTVEKSLPDLVSLKHIIITELADIFPNPRRFIVNIVIRNIKKLSPPYHIPQAIKFNDALKKGKDIPFKNVDITLDDIAFLQYTGGTTGITKGAMLTHKNMVANVMQASAWIAPLPLTSEDILVTALPLYHIFSLTANCLTFLKAGATNILITNPRDLSHFIKEIRSAKFTVISGVNTLFNALLNHPKFDSIDCSRLKVALAGGMALQKSVSLKWKEKTGSRLLEAYGLTETSPAVTVNPLYVNDYNGSVGLPISSTEISIRDDEGTELSIGEKGELCVKGPQVMRGYWQHEEETAHAFWPDGFFRTGDIAMVDHDGFVYLVDRKKDMILVSGFNVYPSEVEHVISMQPGVLEVGVIGVADESSGERVKACIVKKDPSLTEEAIIAHCRQHLTAYKVPNSIEFYAELPKTNVGKILRRALR